MEMTIVLPGNYLQHRVVDTRKQLPSISIMFKECRSLPRPWQIFVHPSARLGRTISRSIADHVSIQLTDLDLAAALLPFRFISFRFPDCIL
jgi:hypothetical protein